MQKGSFGIRGTRMHEKNRRIPHAELSHDTGRTEKMSIHEDCDGVDRRNAPREAAYDISEICFAGNRPPVTCMVHNISGLGARLEAATPELPRRFILANHAKRFRAVCEVVWRDGAQFGVRFVTTPRAMA